MFVELEYDPLLEDFYNNSEMKMESIMKVLENSGSRHSDKANNNVLAGASNGVTWILTDWFIHIDELPKYGQKVLSKTWSLGTTSPFGTSRDFEFYADGKKCGIGTTRWVLFDMNTGRPAKVTDELIGRYGPEHVSVLENQKLDRIPVPEVFEAETAIHPRRNDIDFNHHVHNLVYMDYAMEVLPEEVYQSHQFRNVRITYKNAVKEGETIVAKYAKVDEKHVVIIFGQDQSVKTLISLW